jgi:hypothetical protein
MANPQGHREGNTFQAPAWLVEKAKKDRERAGLAPDALAKKLQELRKNPGESQKHSAEHAMKMSVEPNAFAARLAEVRAKTNSFVVAQKPKQDEMEAHGSFEQRDAIMASGSKHPRVLQLPTPNESPLTPTSPIKTAQRQIQVNKRDERREKKDQVRTKRAEIQLKKSETPDTSPKTATSPSPFPFESSTADTAPQAAVATSESTDVNESSSLFINQTDKYLIHPLPKWYTEIKDSHHIMKSFAKKRPQALGSLDSLKNCIERCEKEMKSAKLQTLYEELRDHVHKAEITLEVNAYLLKKARILDSPNGLPRIFNEEARFPADLKADSYQLYARWCNGDFSQDILRGIVTVKGENRGGDRIDRKYKAEHSFNAKFYGEGPFVLGQWWPTQLCTVRDGVHGTPQGGIFGDKEHGAYSIVLSGGGYKDKDEGDVIEYSGTEGKDFTPTDATLSMLRSAKSGNEIRVIRSSNLTEKKSKYRPEVGFRYDGLYKIKSFEMVSMEKEMYRFRLERCPGQQPIRCEDNAARRPTIFEVEAYKKLKSKVW